MQIELKPETVALAQSLVDDGRFGSIEEAVHAAIRNFADAHAEWLVYAQRNIQEGLDDLAAGRLVDGDEVMSRLRARAHRTAA